MYILDIEMPRMNGLAVVQEIWNRIKADLIPMKSKKKNVDSGETDVKDYV